jgi:DNA/RNA-binding domain of Phe-tRNA-synthetase-like protein
MVSLHTRFAAQRARAAELDTIRLQRPLTVQERNEADNLADRLYMREWRRTFGRAGRRQSSHAA